MPKVQDLETSIETLSGEETDTHTADAMKTKPQGNVFYIEEIDVVLAESMMTMRC